MIRTLGMRRVLVLLAALVALAVVVAACGGDDDDSAQEAVAAEVSEAEEAVEEAAGDAQEAVEEAATEIADIVDTAIAAGDFSTLVAAVQAAELVDTLKGEGPFTVFAPTDEAFAALPEGTLDDLLLPENKDQLAAILTYHVVPGTVLSTDLADGQVATVNGEEVTIAVTDGVTVNGANVVTADIETSNGVIHVIDAVLLPAG
ncbi:MAG: fasciclin domain-containing protein [Gaiellaceae bacterium]